MTDTSHDGDACTECVRRIVEEYPSAPTAAIFAAKMGAAIAWEFSDAITEATSFTHRPGDPGHSRTPRSSKRRR